ncbi:type II secretion system protein [Deferribacter autotrophicus]|uniref:Type II secretion system protein n=1 Tax=Deferribacter autotrophicus TaxID=500465 RepID=A0A5A8F8V8_9BACT|nr:type II secretion system protein [Deferribacter autotrophicus]KAA0259341.1 type II secretion system protein [Deferribacter autotrophicus]
MRINKGFTLIELMVVITIFVILISIAFIAGSKFINRIKLNETVDKIISLINDAQKLSILKGVECDPVDNCSYDLYGIWFSSSGYSLVRYSSTTWPPADDTDVVKIENYTSKFLISTNDNISLISGLVLFNKKGMPNYNFDVTGGINLTQPFVVTVSGYSLSKKITIDQTGNVHAE